MKGPKFNARLSLANRKSDENLARLAATFIQNGMSTDSIHYQAFTKVLRPWMHLLNQAQEENVPSTDVQECIPNLAASMAIELAVRTIPQGTNPMMIQMYVQELVVEITDAVVTAFNAQYGNIMATARPGTPPTHEAPDADQ